MEALQSKEKPAFVHCRNSVWRFWHVILYFPDCESGPEKTKWKPVRDQNFDAKKENVIVKMSKGSLHLESPVEVKISRSRDIYHHPQFFFLFASSLQVVEWGCITSVAKCSQSASVTAPSLSRAPTATSDMVGTQQQSARSHQVSTHTASLGFLFFSKTGKKLWHIASGSFLMRREGWLLNT